MPSPSAVTVDNLSAPIQLPVPRRDFVPSRHMRRATVTDTPVVVIMGDSNSTDLPTTAHDENTTLWGFIQRRLAEENPTKTIAFHNRAIGGATWANADAATLDSTGLGLPGWAIGDDGAQSWVAYIMSLNPTTLILSFGTNDAQNAYPASLKSVRDKFLAYGDAAPDLIFITPIVAARNTANDQISGAIAQNGRLMYAHYIRNFARQNSYGLIDLGRYVARAVQGIDPCHTITSGGTPTVRSMTAANGYTYVGPVTQGDVRMDVSFTASAGFWSGGKRLQLLTSTNGATQAPNAFSFAEVYDNGGSLAVRLVTRTNIGGGADIDSVTITSSVATPTSGSQTLSLSFRDGWAGVKLNGNTVYEGPCLRLGGEVAPALSITGASATTTLTVTDYPCTYLDCMPMLTDVEMFGSALIADGVEGGNDLNHMTSRGLATVVAPVLDSVDFYIPAMAEGATRFANTAGHNVGFGTPTPFGPVHIRKGANGGTYVNVGGRSLLVLEDTTLALIQLLTGASGAAGIEMGPATNPNEGGVIYSAATGNVTVRADDVDALTVLNPSAASAVSIQVRANRAGTITLDQVSIGAANSGGTGFRALVVPN